MPFAKLVFGVLCHAAWFEFSLARESPNAFVPLTEYIFVSQPGQRSVAVTEVNALTRKVTREARPFITSGLREPCGLAVDHTRQRLYVADPKAHKVFMYKLYFGSQGVSVRQDKQYIAAHGMTPRWVAVDDKGTMFATDEARSFVAEVDAETLSYLGRDDAPVGAVQPKFAKLYAGSDTRQVDRPGGIAVDGNNLFWGNRHRGNPYGSILMAPEDPDARLSRGVPRMIHSLSRNVAKVYGVCAAPNLVFYTGGARMVYGAKPASYQGRPSATVMLNDYAMPRGCVWDGDGTVFLADKGGNVVWSFPSSEHSFGLTQATKLFSVDDPYGVAVFRPNLAMNAMGFLRGGAAQVAPALASLLLTALAIFGMDW